MNIETSIKVICDNYHGNEGSLVDSLYNDSYFSDEKFWQFYDSIALLVRNGHDDREVFAQINFVYQRILKEMIYHFSPMDLAVMEHFPENYDDYIERLDFAVLAYHTKNPALLDDDKFVLQRTLV